MSVLGNEPVADGEVVSHSVGGDTVQGNADMARDADSVIAVGVVEGVIFRHESLTVLKARHAGNDMDSRCPPAGVHELDKRVVFQVAFAVKEVVHE